jgi:hypothetical protein
MGYSSKTQRLISLKKLAGKAQTSNDKDLANEGLPSGITITSDTVFGETIAPTPSSSTLYTVTGKVEYLRFPVSFIAGTDTSSGRHGFELKLPADYESNSSNSKKGIYPFLNNQSINITSGSLQLIPTSFSNSYEAKPFYGGSSVKDSGTQIPILDARDWYLDYFNGVMFQQDPPGTGDHSNNPDYIEAFLYIGDMLSTVVENSGGGGGGSGDNAAQYLVLSATGSLTSERVFAPTTGLTYADAGAGGNYTLQIDNSTVATLTGSQFSGNIGITGSLGVQSVALFNQGLSGSLTRLPDGTSYLREGTNVGIVTGSGGFITISATNTVYTAGDGLDLSGTAFAVDVKSLGGLKIDSTELTVDNSVVAMLTGSQFSGAVGVTGSIGSTTVMTSPAFSGSLTRLLDGSSYLREGSRVTITTGSDGSVTISSYGGSGGSGDANAEYITAAVTGSLPNAKVIEAGAGITIITGSSSMTISSDGASLSGRSKEPYLLTSSHPENAPFFTGLTDFSSVQYNKNFIDVYLNGALLHSGTQVQVSASQTDYSIVTSGSLVFAFDLFKDDQLDTVLSRLSDDAASTDQSATYLVLSTTSSLTAERVLTPGIGLTSADGGPGGLFDLAIDNSIVATLTGANFTGPVEFSGTVSGSFPVNRSKDVTFLSVDVEAGTSVSVASDFSTANFEQNKIDIFVNGQLLHSGSSSQISASERDYYIDSATSLKFSFDIQIDDILDVVVFAISS